MKACYGIAVVAIFATLLTGCKTVGGKADLKSVALAEWEDIGPIQCDSGAEPAYFIMIPGSSPQAKITDFSSLKGSEKIDLGRKDVMTRLDLCLSGEVPNLKRVVFGIDAALHEISIEDGAKIEGLKELIFDQDISKLKLIIPFRTLWAIGVGEQESHEYLYVVGSQGNDNAAIATVVRKIAEDYQYEPEREYPYRLHSERGTATKANYGMLGNFEYFAYTKFNPVGDPYEYCRANTMMTGTFQAGEATFEWRGRPVLITANFGNMNFMPNFCEIKITDRSTKLGSNAGKTVLIKVPFVNDKSQVEQNYTHHGDCDTFRIKTDLAEYFFNTGNRRCSNSDRYPSETQSYRSYYGDKFDEGVVKHLR